MKKVNNYEAPKTEVIEIDVNKDIMQGGGYPYNPTFTSGSI